MVGEAAQDRQKPSIRIRFCTVCLTSGPYRLFAGMCCSDWSVRLSMVPPVAIAACNSTSCASRCLFKMSRAFSAPLKSPLHVAMAYLLYPQGILFSRFHLADSFLG
jgi:hypothetical protein